MAWALGLAAAVLVLAGIAGFLWVNRLFEAPEATRVASLAAELGAGCRRCRWKSWSPVWPRP